MSDDNQEYAGACYCGDVTVNVVGPSVMAGYCHCHSCRKWHAAPVNAWSGFPKDKVQINGATVTSMGKGTSRRISCASCGGAVANELAEYDVVVVYPMTLAGSGFQFEPSMHIFYDERVMDINDGLPKFADMPESEGGSGRMVEEPAKSGWRTSG